MVACLTMYMQKDQESIYLCRQIYQSIDMIQVEASAVFDLCIGRCGFLQKQDMKPQSSK